MLRLFLVLLLVTCSTLGVQAAQATATDPAAAVYKIRVKRDGHIADGSAVLIAPGRLLTACHVTRGAQSIKAGRAEIEWRAYPVISDIEHDLCVLTVPELSAAIPATIGATQDLQLGDPVIAVGYPRGGKRDESHGEIKGLHTFDGGTVLQVSAGFDHGQSGGGLFDASGRLIGIIGFKTRTGRDFNFALPLDWAGDAIPGQAAITTGHAKRELAFWQRPIKQRPLFLRAASLEANRDWDTLLGVAHEWVAADEFNPASWLCLGRVLTKHGHEQAAARAFARAESLMPSLDGTQSSSIATVKLADAVLTSLELSHPARQ
jgi:serine protease Do